jgi:ribonuclease D
MPIYNRIRPRDLQSLMGLFSGIFVEKDATFSNWERVQLTPQQIRYAGIAIITSNNMS